MSAASDQLPVPSPRSRRAILAGALGGVGAWAVAAAGMRTRVRAADGDPLLIGEANVGTATTSISNGAGSGNAFAAISANGTGIDAQSVTGTAISGTSDQGTAIFGNAGQGRGVFGNSNGDAAIWGQTDATDAGAVVGYASSDSTGVIGHSGDIDVPPARMHVGVYGHAAQDATSRGVVGESPAGQGVRGETVGGVALYGTADTGYALRTSGRVRADGVSGVATIRAGQTSKTITPGVDVTSASFVLLTPKANIGSRALWFTTDATANTFTIHMSTSRSSSTKVAWLLLG